MRVLLLVALLFAVPAAALTPAPDCSVDESEGRIVDLSDPSGTYVVWVQPYPGGVVSWDWLDRQGRIQGAVQICAAGRGLRYSIGNEESLALHNRLDAMLESETRYTLGDLRRALSAQGARAWEVGDLGRCGCLARGF